MKLYSFLTALICFKESMEKLLFNKLFKDHFPLDHQRQRKKLKISLPFISQKFPGNLLLQKLDFQKK